VRRLIVTADDFGAAEAVNDAVENAHRYGILTAASLMVTGAAAADAAARAKRMPSLRVGLHLVLVEGRAVLPAATLPDLVDRDGFFRTDMARAGAAMFFRPTVRRQLAREIEAQFEAFAATGLAFDHVNAHKHFHLHPTIAGLIAALARKYGVRAVRVPLEPRAVLAAVEPAPFSGVAALTAPFARLQKRRFARAGLMTPDQVFGLRWSGAMTRTRLGGIIAHLPPGLSEIYLHPATGPYPGSAPGYRYAEELAALLDGAIGESARDPHIRRGGFRDALPGAGL
jgi:hopanoid biosynthesis associated protein HpnK